MVGRRRCTETGLLGGGEGGGSLEGGVAGVPAQRTDQLGGSVEHLAHVRRCSIHGEDSAHALAQSVCHVCGVAMKQYQITPRAR